MMPPPGAKRPDEATLTRFATSLETRIDAAAALQPNPGRRPFQRLNRAEYARAVRDLLGLDVDVTALLPPDTISHGFDNIADVQAFSPTLLEGLPARGGQDQPRCARRSDADADLDDLQGAAHRGAAAPRRRARRSARAAASSVVHIFPADGEYTFRMMLHAIPTGQLFGSTDARRADRGFDQRRARGAARHQPAHERSRSERA